MIYFLLFLGVSSITGSLYFTLRWRKKKTDELSVKLDELVVKRQELLLRVDEKKSDELQEKISEVKIMSQSVTSVASNSYKRKLEDELAAKMADIIIWVKKKETSDTDSVVPQFMVLNKNEKAILDVKKQFNSAATEFNTLIDTFPANRLADVLKYKRIQSFKVTKAKDRELTY